MEITNKERKILEKYFGFSELNDSYDIEQWTNGGVDMIIYIDKNSNETLIEQLEEYINNFDIDEEIDLYRENEDYKNNFTIRASLEDFENWVEYINDIIKELKGSK